MSGLMEGASLKELMPDFDKEVFWTEVAAKVPEQQPTKKVIPFGWAARVAAILLVGIGIWMAVRFTGNHSTVTDETAATTQSSIPAIATQPVVSPAPQEATAPAASITQNAKSFTPAKAIVQQQQNEAPQLMAPKVTTEAGPPLGPLVPAESPVAIVKKKVTHYLDIDDEPAPVATAAGSTTPFIQIKLNKPVIQEQNLQPKPFKELTLALAR